jgi:hypothetical protein
VQFVGPEEALDKNLCNIVKRPTGQTGEAGDRIHWCMAIEKKIMKKTHSGMLGFSLDDNSTHLDKDAENSRRGGLEGGVNESFLDSEYDDKDNPIAAPAPVNMPLAPPLLPPIRCSLHHSPHQFPPATDTEEVQQQATSVNDNGMTSAPAMDARTAPRKADSTIKAKKKLKTSQIKTRSLCPLRVRSSS